MSYKLRVVDEEQFKQANSEEFCFDFFEKFMDECGYRDTDKYKLDHYLKKYNARNLPGTPFVEFDSEQEAMLFVLKWS